MKKIFSENTCSNLSPTIYDQYTFFTCLAFSRDSFKTFCCVISSSAIFSSILSNMIDLNSGNAVVLLKSIMSECSKTSKMHEFFLKAHWMTASHCSEMLLVFFLEICVITEWALSLSLWECPEKKLIKVIHFILQVQIMSDSNVGSWITFFGSLFFVVNCLDEWNPWIWQVSCRGQGMLTQGPAPDPKCKLNT